MRRVAFRPAVASSKDRFRHRFAISSLVQRPEEAEPDGHNR
jgi:hypothetical protein